jgi:glycosyltransferase involved in cell wall biosynthesis
LKKILQIITKADWAGAQRVVYEICKLSIQEKDIIMEVAVGNDGILKNKIEELGIKVHVLNNLKHSINFKEDYNGYKEIKNLIKKNKYDVIHCHSTKAGILGRMAAYKLGVKNIIYTVHGYWPILQFKGIKRKLAIFVERYLAKKTTNLVLISKSDVELSKKMKIGNSSKYRLIYNKITVEKQKIKKGILKRELEISDDIKIIGNVSRLDNPKNPFLFVDIAKNYLKQSNDTIFVWVGDGSLKSKVQKIVKNENLENKIFFIGFKENGIDYMNDFDMLLLTSNWEGVPITILEAIELGIPILSTDVGGIKEIIGEKSIFDKNSENINFLIEKKLTNNQNKLSLFINNFENYINLYEG